MDVREYFFLSFQSLNIRWNSFLSSVPRQSYRSQGRHMNRQIEIFSCFRWVFFFLFFQSSPRLSQDIYTQYWLHADKSHFFGSGTKCFQDCKCVCKRTGLYIPPKICLPSLYFYVENFSFERKRINIFVVNT